MAVEDDDNEPCSNTNDDPDAVVQQPSKDVIMKSGELVQLEVGEDEDDEDDEENNEDSDDDDSEGGDQADEDEDEGEDDYGYASA